jgi:ATP-dependent Clp protease ATP-binding subunit ClpA
MSALTQFSPRSQRVVAFAQEEARLFKHAYVGTEHLLLGLLDEGDGTAYESLATVGVERDRVWRTIETLIGRGPTTPTGTVPLTPRARTVLQKAMETASAMGSLAEPEHILRFVFADDEAVATRSLVALGVTPPGPRAAAMFRSAGNGAKVLANGVSTTDIAGGPVCPHCRRSLNDGVELTDVPAGDRSVTIVSCRSCHHTIGIAPNHC